MASWPDLAGKLWPRPARISANPASRSDRIFTYPAYSSIKNLFEDIFEIWITTAVLLTEDESDGRFLWKLFNRVIIVITIMVSSVQWNEQGSYRWLYYCSITYIRLSEAIVYRQRPRRHTCFCKYVSEPIDDAHFYCKKYRVLLHTGRRTGMLCNCYRNARAYKYNWYVVCARQLVWIIQCWLHLIITSSANYTMLQIPWLFVCSRRFKIAFKALDPHQLIGTDKQTFYFL